MISQEDAKQSEGHRSRQGPGGHKGVEQPGTIFGTVRAAKMILSGHDGVGQRERHCAVSSR